MSAMSETESERLLADLIAGRLPDARGRFGVFGGRYVPETLIPAHERLEQGVRRWLRDADYQRELVARDYPYLRPGVEPAPSRDDRLKKIEDRYWAEFEKNDLANIVLLRGGRG